jgi:GNAT superfamily N-acetyltransferase
VSSRRKQLCASLRIREAHGEECPVLTAIALAAKAHWGYPAEWIALWRDELTYTPAVLARDLVLCAESIDENGESRIVGVASISRDPASGELIGLWVRPDWMDEGIGRALFAAAAAAGRRLGAARMRVVSDPNAEAFYLRLGCRPAGTVSSRPLGRKLPVLVFELKDPV